MDIGVLFGLILAVGAIIGADMMDGGVLSTLLNPSAALLVLGGTLGVTAVCSQFSDLLAIPRLVLTTLRPPKVDLGAEVERLVALALKARRNGLLAMEEDIAGIDDPFLTRGLQLVVDGADAETVRGVLRTEMVLRQRVAARQAALFEAAGGFAPTMGIIGTVLGLIHVLANLSNANKLGPSIATAFLATFYGISTANVFWLPLAGKMKHNARLAATRSEVVVEGVLSIQAGDNPSSVRDKLNVFLQGSPSKRPAPKEEPAAGAAGEAAPADGDGRHRVA